MCVVFSALWILDKLCLKEKTEVNQLAKCEMKTLQTQQEWAVFRIRGPGIKGTPILRGEMGCQSCDNSRLLSKSHSLHYCSCNENCDSTAKLQQGTSNVTNLSFFNKLFFKPE